MSNKVGRPGFEGQRVVVKVPKELLEKIDEKWPRAEFASRNEFIRHALAKAVRELEEVIPCS